ncbi:MAG TPA: DUF4166 domain-containing protein [Steroidobacteraceae bacterium]|jgi:hypothetical protein|nr:DUF4166 domain-containing protein [Steroidobacteraceae bacterium]
MRAIRNRLTPNPAGRDRAPIDWSHARADVETRFAHLAGDSWQLLPAAIRRRFSRHLADGERIVYLGEVAATRLTAIGWLLAQLARLAGAPLPLEASGRVPVTVIVGGCARLGGQSWTRIYDRVHGLPQVIQSIKRFGGATGLEEIVARGIGMRLTLEVRDRALVFRSAGYFIQCLGIRLSLPDWLTPGVIEVVHREESFGQFSFSLSVTHRWAGRVIDQIAFFRED